MQPPFGLFGLRGMTFKAVLGQHWADSLFEEFQIGRGRLFRVRIGRQDCCF